MFLRLVILSLVALATNLLADVELTSFNVSGQNCDRVLVTWSTASETNSAYFNLYLNGQWRDSIPGQGDSPIGHNYATFIDGLFSATEYCVSLWAVATDQSAESLAYDCDQTLSQLENFNATGLDRTVDIAWRTRCEVELDHFELLRNNLVVLNMQADGTPDEGVEYHWIDNGVVGGIEYCYALVSVNINGSREILDTACATPFDLPVHHEQASAIASQSISLRSYPNPCNAKTALDFVLPRSMIVTLSLRDVLGREVLRLHDGLLHGGPHSIDANLALLPSGLYFATLGSEGSMRTTRLLLLK